MTDQEIFKSIESIREEIIAQNLPINQIDFGAGNPNECRDAATMEQGVLKQTSSAEMCRIGLKGEWAEKLYFMIKEQQPKVVLELGTCCGFSSIYMSKACSEAKIYTIEGSPELAEIAKRNREKAGCQNVIQKVGRFNDVLPSLLPEISPVDFAFIDGHHDRDATIDYFEKILPYMSEGGIMLFDDISWSRGMEEAWKVITENTNVTVFFDEKKFGAVVVNKNIRLS